DRAVHRRRRIPAQAVTRHHHDLPTTVTAARPRRARRRQARDRRHGRQDGYHRRDNDHDQTHHEPLHEQLPPGKLIRDTRHRPSAPRTSTASTGLRATPTVRARPVATSACPEWLASWQSRTRATPAPSTGNTLGCGTGSPYDVP